MANLNSNKSGESQGVRVTKKTTSKARIERLLLKKAQKKAKSWQKK
jgi:hypothetical protein